MIFILVLGLFKGFSIGFARVGYADPARDFFVLCPTLENIFARCVARSLNVSYICSTIRRDGVGVVADVRRFK